MQANPDILSIWRATRFRRGEEKVIRIKSATRRSFGRRWLKSRQQGVWRGTSKRFLRRRRLFRSRLRLRRGTRGRLTGRGRSRGLQRRGQRSRGRRLILETSRRTQGRRAIQLVQKQTILHTFTIEETLDYEICRVSAFILKLNLVAPAAEIVVPLVLRLYLSKLRKGGQARALRLLSSYDGIIDASGRLVVQGSMLGSSADFSMARLVVNPRTRRRRNLVRIRAGDQLILEIDDLQATPFVPTVTVPLEGIEQTKHVITGLKWIR